MRKETMEYNEALKKLTFFCAYRERCVLEVRVKLQSLKVPDEMGDKLVEELREENFINERRFAESFVRGKLRNNCWGREKIRSQLAKKQISGEFIEYAIGTIEEDEYQSIIEKVARLKLKIDPQTDQLRLIKYLRQKGFESELSWDLAKKFAEIV